MAEGERPGETEDKEVNSYLKGQQELTKQRKREKGFLAKRKSGT